MELSEKLKKKLDSLIALLQAQKVIVAFSGGIDSSLLAYLSKNNAKETLLITMKSVLYSEEEAKEASNFALKFNIPHLFLETEPLSNEEFIKNKSNRCYTCKKDIFAKILKVKEERAYNLVIEGSNITDLGDFRPGLDALKELNITSPYIKTEIDKDEIRVLSKYFQLETELKPSGACFASRIPYNQVITETKLKMVENAEKFLKDSFNLTQLRVRFHDEKIARIEVLKDDIEKITSDKAKEIIIKKFKEIGFYYVTIDLEGFRSGSLNEILSI
ncbi:MAG: ATP-dependent sacrificial sulfur transferase LarE [Promethearchaeota archaeon]